MARLVPRPGNRQTRNRHRLAPQGIQAFLDMEVAAGKAKPTTGVEGDPRSGPADVAGEYILDRTRYRSHDGRIARPGVAEGEDMSAIWRGRIVLGCTVACLAAAASWTLPASAGCISQTFGSTTMHNCDGKISTSHTVGETTVHNFDGKLGTSQTVGNTTVHNLGNKLGTSHTVGTTTMHNFDGKFGWSQRFGNIVVHSGALFTDR